MTLAEHHANFFDLGEALLEIGLVVTSATDLEAKNAGLDELPPRELRYDRADEVVEACFALWDSWDEDALVLDKKAGIMSDPAKVHYANYEGRWIRTRGPLSIPRSPQGHPVIIAAGASDTGQDLAARVAGSQTASRATEVKMTSTVTNTMGPHYLTPKRKLR